MAAATQQRKAIRDEVYSRVKAALPYLDNDAITQNMRVDIREGQHHCVSIFFLKGEVGGEYERDTTAKLVVRIVTNSQHGCDRHGQRWMPQDELDGIASNIEDALTPADAHGNLDNTLGGLVQYIDPTDWQYATDDSGHHQLGLIYEVNFQTED